MQSNYKSLSKDIQERIKEDKKNNVQNPYACADENIIRRFSNHDIPRIWRPAFTMDVEKILHNNYYNRYSDKTQVFSFYKNDDISRRALHVQLVSRVARTIGTTLGLNLDLIEAISLGHDIGHTPFGHVGERYLNDLYYSQTGKYFNHNVHSVRVLDKLIMRNISLQVLDGILCHNGEMEQQKYRPKELVSFDEFDKNINSCYTMKSANSEQRPSTLEGCVMRISDIIAYLGKDRQDAEKIGLIDSSSTFTTSSIGLTNSEIINNITVSIIEHSYGKPYISMDEETFSALKQAKAENGTIIYKNSILEKKYNDNIAPMFSKLYNYLLQDLSSLSSNSIIYKHHIEYLKNANQYSNYFNFDEYINSNPNDIVTDFIASMTDDYFIELYNHLFPNSPYHIDYIGYF